MLQVGYFPHALEVPVLRTLFTWWLAAINIHLRLMRECNVSGKLLGLHCSKILTQRVMTPGFFFSFQEAALFTPAWAQLGLYPKN